VKLCVTFVIRRPQSLGGKKHPEGRLLAPKRPDLDNLQKGLQDALKGFWEDDSQIVELNLRKVYAAKGEEPKIEVQIHTYEKTSETNERP
jgi:Holliday junction resolvase RusA-like endonuclease